MRQRRVPIVDRRLSVAEGVSAVQLRVPRRQQLRDQRRRLSADIDFAVRRLLAIPMSRRSLRDARRKLRHGQDVRECWCSDVSRRIVSIESDHVYRDVLMPRRPHQMFERRLSIATARLSVECNVRIGSGIVRERRVRIDGISMLAGQRVFIRRAMRRRYVSSESSAMSDVRNVSDRVPRVVR